MRRRLGLGATLAALALVAALAALVGPVFEGAPSPTLIALDHSASVDAAMRAAESRWVSAAISAGACRAPCRVVTFAAGASLRPAAAADLGGATVPDADATDIARGVEAAVAAGPRGARVLVMSDGEETAPSTEAVAEAAERGDTVDAVLLHDPARRDAALTRLDAPRAVHRGDTISLLVTVRSTTISPATLVVKHDGLRATQVVQLHTGDNPYTLSYTATARGWHSFQVSVELVGDQVSFDDARTVSVHVGPPPRVIVVSGPEPSSIGQLLAARGAAVATSSAAALPVDAARYASVDTLVLDDLPAGALTSSQVTALDIAVREGGLGLLVLGGRHAFSLGGYAQSPLGRMLPVSSLVPGDLQRRNLALELVLDRSGSMSDLAGGVKKITMVQVAARQVARFAAKHRDELGIVDFDIVPHTLVAMRRVAPGGGETKVLSQIDGLQADGGTDIYLGLQRGLRQLLKSTSRNRHVILLTDGISQPHNYTTLLTELARRHIAVATVALGTDVDEQLLQQIASSTSGNTYATSNAHDLPRIFAKETRLNAKPVQTHGHQQVVAEGSSPVVRSLAGKSLPALSGNVVTRLRPGAEADLLARSGTATADPALAQWSYGLGRVVSWTPGLTAPWGASWAREPALWNDAARWVARGVVSPAVAALATQGTSTQVEIDLSSQSPIPITTIPGSITVHGRAIALRFTESAPSIYTAALEQLPEGSYALTIDLPATDGGSQEFPVDVPYPAEFLPTPDGLAALGQLVAPTGGKVFDESNVAAAFPARNTLRRWLIATAALLFLLSVLVRMVGRVQFASRMRSATGRR